jgi:hypothetical protein
MAEETVAPALGLGQMRLRSPSLPCFNTHMVRPYCILPAMLLLTCMLSSGQNSAPNPPAAKPANDYSGMYSFLQDGEFVQLTVEDAGSVTGFISRYGDSESDRGEFLDLFFKSGKLDGTKLSFITQTVHGVWYEFRGVVVRGPGKNPGDEAYYVLKGTLTQNNTDANKKTSSKSRDVAFKSFPQDMGAPAAPSN